MNSEKVKEIKKVLEQNTKTCLLYDFGKETECKVFQCKDILTLINELESENERLRHLNNSISLGADLHTQSYKQEIKELENKNDRLLEEGKTLVWLNQNMCNENQQLKDRIAELEKENESLKKQLIAIDTLDETNFEKRHNAIVFITEKQLKQFAGRLKEKVIEIIKSHKNIFEHIDLSDSDDILLEKVSKAIFGCLDYSTAINSGLIETGATKDGYSFFIKWKKPLTFNQCYYILNIIVNAPLNEYNFLDKNFSRLILTYISPDDFDWYGYYNQ